MVNWLPYPFLLFIGCTLTLVIVADGNEIENFAESGENFEFLDSEDAFARKKDDVINKCCPVEHNRYEGARTHFCCMEGLFRDAAIDEEPLRECRKYSDITEEAIVRTIRCAQHEMFGRKAADICKISCCELFMNISPPTHTDCSRHCVYLMRRPDMNVERLVNSLDYCKEGAEMQFQAFENCVGFRRHRHHHHHKRQDQVELCERAIGALGNV